MTELWVDIKGYEGFYQVSNLGRIKSLDRYVYAGMGTNHITQHLSSRILKSYVGEYTSVVLSKYGKIKRFLVHRLVAEAFIPNPNNYPCVNHKDENKNNNVSDNLEWCTYEYNNRYNGRIDKCKSKISNTLKGRKLNKVLTDEQREHIRQGAIKGWEKRKQYE